MPLEFLQVPLSALAVGSVLSAPIFELGAERTKLLGKDVEIDAQALKQLAARGVAHVSISKRDLAAMMAGRPQGNRRVVEDHTYTPVDLQTERTREVEAEMASLKPTSLPNKPLDSRWNNPPITRFDPDTVKHKVSEREQQVSQMETVFTELVLHGGTDDGDLAQVCRLSISSMFEDKDLFMQLGLNPFDSEYPSRHSLHVSSIAISIGVMLGLDDQSLLDLGTGCLIHDVGMLKLDPALYRSKRKLSRSEMSILAQHPIMTLEALACPGVQLSRIARIVAYQIHERCDGSGYPRGIEANQIHSLSKIAMVADCYVGLVSNRQHRRALMPYFAIEKLLKTMPRGLYDAKALRGLLHAMSLFPIGSCVELTDGQIARVVRSTGETYTQPIVEFWNNQHRRYEPDLVNLKAENRLKIRRAIPEPAAA